MNYYDPMLWDYIPENNDNDLDNNNNYFDNREEEPGKIAIFFVLLISVILVGMDLMSLYYSYDYLKENIRTNPPEVFDQCIKYPVITEIFFTVFATMAGLSAMFLSLGYLVAYELFVEKFLKSFLYFNYYIFGPVLLASSFFGLFNAGKVGYSCEDNNPATLSFDLGIIISLVIILVFGVIVTSTYSSIDIFDFFSDSIRFTKDGNYLLGKTFWKYVFSRSRVNYNRERNE